MKQMTEIPKAPVVGSFPTPSMIEQRDADQKFFEPLIEQARQEGYKQGTDDTLKSQRVEVGKMAEQKAPELREELRNKLMGGFCQTVENGAMCEDCCSNLGADANGKAQCEMSECSLEPDEFCPQQIEVLDNLLPTLLALFDSYFAAEAKKWGWVKIPIGVCGTCGGQMSLNPHPNAGKPGVAPDYVEIGTVNVCIPCTCKSRHTWAERAMKAEGELAEARKGYVKLDKLQEIEIICSNAIGHVGVANYAEREEEAQSWVEEAFKKLKVISAE